MAINFPTSLDALTNPIGTDKLNSPNHADQHSNENDILEALETKVGITNSADVNSLDYKVANKLNLDQTTQQHIINGRPVFDQGLELGLAPTVGAHVNGKMFWDDTFKTPACDLEDDVTLQIGQENQIYAYNGTGSDIIEGKAVYIVSTQAGIPSIALALGDGTATEAVVGLVTSTTITNGAYGYVTTLGHVNDIDTSAWNLNDVLYLSPDTAGMLVNVKPNTGDYDTRVGRVMLKDASTGRVFVNVIREYQVGVISAGNGVEMFPDDTTITAAGTQSTYPIKTLSKTPITTTEDVDTITMAGNTVMYGTYLNTAPIGKTTIAGGVWTFDIWAGVSSATNATSLYETVSRVRPGAGTVSMADLTATSKTVTASTGTPFATTKVDVGGTLLTDSFLQTPKGLYRILTIVNDTTITIEVPSTYTNESTVAFSVYKRLFNVNTGEINNVATIGTPWTGLQRYTVTTVQPAFTVEATDTLASSFIGTSTGARSVYFSHNGTTRYSHFTTPLVTSHNDLSGLNDGDYKHLTATQFSALHGVNDANTTSNSYADGKVEDSIVDGHTTVAPSGNAVYDALAGKIDKTTLNAYSVLTADTDDTPTATSLGTNTLLGRINSGIVSVAIDSDLSSTSAGDDSVPSAKATKAMGDLKLPLAGGTMTGNLTLGDAKQIVLTAPSADVTCTGFSTSAFVSGYTSSAVGDLVYLDSNAKWQKVDADAIATAGGMLGIALAVAAADASLLVALPGSFVRVNAWNWTVSNTLYAGETPGALQATIPTGADGVVRVIGWACNADYIYFYPSQDNSTVVA